MSNNFLASSMGWLQKSASQPQQSAGEAPQQQQQQTNKQTHSEEEEPTEDWDQTMNAVAVRVSSCSQQNTRSQSPPTPSSVGFIKSLWQAQRSFDAATSAAIKTLQKRTMVRNLPRSPTKAQASSYPALRRPPLDDLDEDLFPLEDESEILTEKDFRKLSAELPKRLVSSSWKRIFSTSFDGFSLSTVYRRMMPSIHRPALMVIRDTNGNRFGAFVSESFHVSEKSFGSGETFVFKMREEDQGLQVWHWTCKNDFFVLCSFSSLCIGVDDGKFGIYLDENLFHGRTQRCKTFDNEPLTPTGDFQATIVEIWSFE